MKRHGLLQMQRSKTCEISYHDARDRKPNNQNRSGIQARDNKHLLMFIDANGPILSFLSLSNFDYPDMLDL